MEESTRAGPQHLLGLSDLQTSVSLPALILRSTISRVAPLPSPPLFGIHEGLSQKVSEN